MALDLTIGLPCYGNETEVWFTVQALRLYQDLTKTEILVIDNKGEDTLKKKITMPGVRYIRFNKVNGPGPAKNKLFQEAKGDFVLCMDSHVFLWPDSIRRLKEWVRTHWDDASNLIHGPMVLKNLTNAYTHYENKWRGGMWGIWPKPVSPSTLEPHNKAIEIEIGPTGLFGCRKDSWLGFAENLKGFGGIEGIINKKYEKAGRKSLCLPFLMWVHYFGSLHAYPLATRDKVRNFLLSFKEIDLDPAPIYEHFGKDYVAKVQKDISNGVSEVGNQDSKQSHCL